MNGTTTLGTVTLSGGSASLSTAKLAMGQATITATYKGNASFMTSTASVTQAVNQDGTTTTVTSSPSTSVYGQSVTFSFTVKRDGSGWRNSDRQHHAHLRLDDSGNCVAQRR